MIDRGFAVAIAIVLAGCQTSVAPPPPPLPPPPPAPAPLPPPPAPLPPPLRADGLAAPIADANFVRVPVFYATNRRKLSDTAREGMFANTSSDTVSYGGLEVTIPLIHTLGEIERPGTFYGYFFAPDPKKHFTIAFNRSFDRAAFFGRVNQNLGFKAGAGRKQALIFVHGFNVGFDEAAFRTAQISHDMKFKGTPLFFSWPSAKDMSPLGYSGDSSRIEESQLEIKRFFIDVASQTAADDIYVIAHSMGTRGVARALRELAVENPATARRIRALVLAAPDINKKVFVEQIAPALRTVIPNVTIYASDEDRALLFSKGINVAERLGDTGAGIAVMPGLLSIDASAARMTWLGHSEYGSSAVLLCDIGSIIDGTAPARRPWLVRKAAGGLPYYAISRPRC